MVTWHDLGFSALAIIGVVIAAAGLLSWFGAGMSDSPSDENRRDGRNGCATLVLGLALLALSIWRLLA